jgi:hypothetical protein
MRSASVSAALIPLLLAADVDSRTAEIEQQRDAKQAKLAPDNPSTWEQRLIYIKDAKVLERISAGIAGFRVKIGGMPTGGGFALGPEYFREDLAGGKLTVNAALQATGRQWWKGSAGVGSNVLGRGKVFWEAHASHYDYNSLTYYGPGPDSEKSARSNYRLEATEFNSMLGARPHRYLRFGGSVGYLRPNVGPGQDGRYISTDRAWRDNPLAPGTEQQTDFFRSGVFAQLDYRDNPFGPRSGGNYTLRFDDYQDRDLSRHDFRRLDLELQQYVPLYNKRRVIALRARSVQSFTRSGQTVPFYQQATIGGADDLRGYRPYRFHDRNMVVMNAEYRWEVFSGLDMALFADAGRVSPKGFDFKVSDLETSVGFGLRFNVRNAPFLRIDVGFSHEGFQVFLKFNGAFAQRPWSSSGAPHIF